MPNRRSTTRWRWVRMVGCAAALVLTLPASGVSAAAGDLDRRFGIDGVVRIDVGDFDAGSAVALQPDERIVVAGVGGGDFAVVRLLSDGSLDHGFGGDGVVTTDFFGEYDVATGVAVQRDRSIVTAGWAFDGGLERFALARYVPDNGGLDSSFGGGGLVRTDLGETDVGHDVAIQPDGRMVVVGLRSSSQSDIVVLRYRAG